MDSLRSVAVTILRPTPPTSPPRYDVNTD